MNQPEPAKTRQEWELNNFLKSLTELTLKYGLRLWACSCCEGISVEKTHVPRNPRVLQNLKWQVSELKYVGESP